MARRWGIEGPDGSGACPRGQHPSKRPGRETVGGRRHPKGEARRSEPTVRAGTEEISRSIRDGRASVASVGTLLFGGSSPYNLPGRVFFPRPPEVLPRA